MCSETNHNYFLIFFFIKLSALYPNTCQNINLHFIAIRGQIHTLKLVQLTDNESNMVMNIRNALQICVQE